MHNQLWNRPNPDTRAICARQGDDQDDGSRCLPANLSVAAPDCALSCIQEFIKSNYAENTCPFTSSLTYLCTSRTSSGLTIGEGSLRCLVSRCTGDDLTRIGVYNICDSIPGAIPKTLSVITATLQPMTATFTMATPLPPTIGNPTSTQEVTSIVMASGVPAMPPPSAPPPISADIATTSLPAVETVQPSSTKTASETGSTGSAVAVAEGASLQSGLSTTQIAGIGVGAGLATLIILALVFYFCRRREKLQRRRSTRWSMHEARTHPLAGGAPPELPILTKSLDNGLLSPLGSNQRYYASAPLEEKRRSFWRRSIKPEEIGVAVAHGVTVDSSPTSLSSQQSMAKLLPKVPERVPTRAAKALWPPPLNLDATRISQSYMLRPISDVTVFDEDLEANPVPQPPRILEARDSLSLMFPSKVKRDKVLPAPLGLNSVSQESYSSARIPLTPTYDNGNVVNNPSRAYPPSSWRQTRQPEQQVSPPPLSALPEEASPTRITHQNRSVLRKKPLTRVTNNPDGGETAARAPVSKPVPVRKDSGTTVATEIEEDTTPEEGEKRLEIIEKPRPPPILVTRTLESTEEPRSPISNLKYPPIPRSATISRVAEFVPQPLKNLQVPSIPSQSAPVRPSRDQLVRNESSFMVTDTTSEDGYLSDHSIDWPAPPTSQGATNFIKTGMTKLRENPSSANRGVVRRQIERSMDQVLRFGPRTSSLRPPPPLSTANAKVPPNTPNEGDLYFTVEL